MRFYDPDSGAVYVDGRDVRTYEKDELHRKFGIVFQNDLVFHESLRDNINFGRGLDDSALKNAVKDAQAAEFIDGLEDGLDHMADIKGANLSGGQRQRILVSRALAGNSEILVLDDASSALDYKTDAQLRKALREHYSHSTLILIAQRVSSICTTRYRPCQHRFPEYHSLLRFQREASLQPGGPAYKQQIRLLSSA